MYKNTILIYNAFGLLNLHVFHKNLTDSLWEPFLNVQCESGFIESL